VIGHKKVRLNNRSVGSSSSSTDGTTDIFSQSATVGVGTQRSKTLSRAETLSEAETHGTNWSHTHTEADTVGEADTVSETDSHSTGTSGSRGTSDERSANSGSSLSYDRPGLLGAGGLPASGTESSGSSRGSGSSSQEGWSEQDSHSSGTAHTTSRSHASSDAETVGGSHAVTTGQAATQGEADTVGSSHSHATTKGNSIGKTHGTTHGKSDTGGWSEAYEPIMANLPAAVHSLQNVKHQAAELLIALPTGTCVVRTLRDGRIEGAIVRVPERVSLPVDDTQYAADLNLVMEYGGVGQPMKAARAAIEEREQSIIAEAATLISSADVEPKNFRVPISNRKTQRGRSEEENVNHSKD
jgi:hypothetical protein